jgi:alcohol dehydrogenase, propanol-preferring
VRALRLMDWKSSPQFVDVEEPRPGPGQVVVRIGGAGACRSDIHLMHDYERGMLPWDPPFTLGHENTGWVHTLGAGVTGLELDQPVAVYGPWGCGACERCLLGMENYCEDVLSAPVPNGGGGLGLDGGMAELMLVPNARQLVALPDGLSPANAAPYIDAGLTSYHAIRRATPKLSPGTTALVIGVGGLGHLAVQILKATSAARVIASDVRPEARQLALECGADEVIIPGESAAQEVRDATGGRGADVILDFVGTDSTMALGAAAGRVLGDFSVVGIGGGSLRFAGKAVPHELSIQHPYWGSRPELREVLDLASRGLVRAEITTFALDEAIDAYRAVELGDIVGRAVITPNLS